MNDDTDNRGRAPQAAEILVLALATCHSTKKLTEDARALNDELLRQMHELSGLPERFRKLEASLRAQYAPEHVQRAAAVSQHVITEFRAQMQKATADHLQQAAELKRAYRLRGAIGAVVGALLLVAAAGLAVWAGLVPSRSEVQQRRELMDVPLVYRGAWWVRGLEERNICDERGDCQTYVRVSE